jgi:hypothetical protein
MYVLGVDPGAAGGLAVIDTDTMQLVQWERMPTIKFRGKSLLDAKAADAFMRVYPISHCVIEFTSARPAQGVSSSFSFGRITGSIETMCLLHCQSTHWVAPSKWKAYQSLTHTNKRASVDLAKLKFGVDFKLADNGPAEAALIADSYVRQVLTGGGEME